MVLNRLILKEEKNVQYPTEVEFGNIQLKFATILIHSVQKYDDSNMCMPLCDIMKKKYIFI